MKHLALSIDWIYWKALGTILGLYWSIMVAGCVVCAIATRWAKKVKK